MIFKPWGELDWLLSNLSVSSYDFLGCLSTEDRCLEAVRILKEKEKLSKKTFWEIIDPIDTEEHINNRAEIQKHLNDSLALPDANIDEHSLLEPYSLIVDNTNKLIQQSEGNILLDISSFPKRFFFPITKLLLKSSKVSNLIITYTTPQAYCEGNLSDNPHSWAHLPLFQVDDPENENFKLVIVGVGFMPLGLSELLKDKINKIEVKLLFPFPPGPPTYQRSWEFIHQINKNSTIDVKQIIRIDTHGLPDIFNKICSLGNHGFRKTLFAPYGPKTFSLAMCLYASQTDSAVYYTQPTVYDPKYSYGVSKCLGYCIKLNGKNLYTI